MGVQFGVNYVCIADISEAFGEKYISARLIDVETAEIVNTHNVSGQMNSMSKCLEMANAITDNLTKGTFAEQAKNTRKAEQLKAQGLVDLGLPSGTLWKKDNEPGIYTYREAVNKYGHRLPTKEQFEELINMCNWSCVVNKGFNVTGPNGNSIFIPAAGFTLDVGYYKLENVGLDGRYMSSTPAEPFVVDGKTYGDQSWDLELNTERKSTYVCKGWSNKMSTIRLVQNQ